MHSSRQSWSPCWTNAKLSRERFRVLPGKEKSLMCYDTTKIDSKRSTMYQENINQYYCSSERSDDVDSTSQRFAKGYLPLWLQRQYPDCCRPPDKELHKGVKYRHRALRWTLSFHIYVFESEGTEQKKRNERDFWDFTKAEAIRLFHFSVYRLLFTGECNSSFPYGVE